MFTFFLTVNGWKTKGVLLILSMVFVLGIAVALRQCLTEDFVEYSKQILINSQALANRLMELGYTLVTGCFRSLVY